MIERPGIFPRPFPILCGIHAVKEVFGSFDGFLAYSELFGDFLGGSGRFW